jgi:hypothetical protein
MPSSCLVQDQVQDLPQKPELVVILLDLPSFHAHPQETFPLKKFQMLTTRKGEIPNYH